MRQEPVQAQRREHLRAWLGGGVVNSIIFTTMQKFEERFECLSERKNIVVMADEAHRGQYGLTERVKFTHNEAGEAVAKRVFGDYIDVYDMTQAVEDGATRPVYYAA